MKRFYFIGYDEGKRAVCAKGCAFDKQMNIVYSSRYATDEAPGALDDPDNLVVWGPYFNGSLADVTGLWRPDASILTWVDEDESTWPTGEEAPKVTFPKPTVDGMKVTVDPSATGTPKPKVTINWGDGTITDDSVKEHTYAKPGKYQIQVTAINPVGGDTVTQEVEVGGSAPKPTVTKVDPDSGSTAGGDTITVTGTGFKEGSK